MKKNNHYKKEIEFKIGEGNEDAIIEFAKSAEAKEFGLFYTKFSGGEGFAIGRPPNPFECEGNGLPEPDNRLPHREFHFEFDVRFTLNESDDIELLIAQKDMPTHFRFMLKGLSPKQAQMALINFEQGISNAIKDAIYHHASVCYRKQDENRKRRKETYGNLISVLGHNLKTRLDLWRYKKPKVENKGGIKLKTFTPSLTQGGTNPQTKVEVEKERQEYKKAVFDALELIETEGGKKKQLDVGQIVFEKESDVKEDIDVASRMKHALRKYKLNFKELLKEYEQKKGE